MTPEIRRAALRMAAKAALLTTLGCSGGAPAPATPLAHQGDAPASAPAPAPSCATYLAGLPTAKMQDLPDGDPLKGRHDQYGAFADPAARTAARTVACCTEVLAHDGTQADARWPCCSALAVTTGEQPMACTPWGPPCPPEMA